MAQRSAIAEAELGHRRGVVLGFTMAELLLLLLFCLLLVAASAIAKKDLELADLRQQRPEPELRAANEKLADRNRELEAVLAELAPTIAPEQLPRPLDPFWQELALAKDFATSLAENGIELKNEDTEKLAESSAFWLAKSDADRALLAETDDFLEASGLSVSELRKIVEESASAQAILAEGVHDWPPIITLSDREFSFPTNSAEVSATFSSKLTDETAVTLAELLGTYDVDVIEVVGHTDEVAITSRRESNLDEEAIRVMAGTAAASTLIPVDNSGLGLARAIAVANILQHAPALQGQDQPIKIIPLSAAQLVLPGDIVSDGTDAGDSRARRRIEIRVRRTTESVVGQ